MKNVFGTREDVNFCSVKKDEGEKSPEGDEDDFSPKTKKRRGFFFVKTSKNLPRGCFQN